MRSCRKIGEPPTLVMKTDTPPTTRKTKASAAAQQTSSKALGTPRQATPKVAAQQQPVYNVGDKVLCLHRGSIYYEAKILSEKVLDNGERGFLVHYQGWNTRYDEEVPFSEISKRFAVYSVEAAAEAKQAQKVAVGSASKKSKNRTSGVTDSTAKLGGTPSGTAASSRSSTPFESTKRRQPRDSSLVETGGKRSRQQAPKTDPTTPLSSLVPPIQSTGVSSSSTAPTQIVVPARKLQDNFLESFPLTFCDILRVDHENVQKGHLPMVPARITIEDIVGDYKETIGRDDGAMRIEYGATDSLEQTTSVYLSLCADGVVDCFDSFVRSDLLYKAEWEMHDKRFRSLSEKQSNKNGAVDVSQLLPHKHYGVVHLLRLLSKMNVFLERLQLQKDIRYSSHANVQDFVTFVAKNIKKYYNAEEDYK